MMRRCEHMIRRDGELRQCCLNEGHVFMHRAGPLTGKFGISPVSVKRQRDNRARQHVVSAMREVARGRCARCGRCDLPIRGHERLARAHGGDIIRPDVLLDDLCNTWCEDNPQTAAWTGWKVSAKWPHDPALEPWEARALNGDVIDLRVFQCEALADGAVL